MLYSVGRNFANSHRTKLRLTFTPPTCTESFGIKPWGPAWFWPMWPLSRHRFKNHYEPTAFLTFFQKHCLFEGALSVQKSNFTEVQSTIFTAPNSVSVTPQERRRLKPLIIMHFSCWASQRTWFWVKVSISSDQFHHLLFCFQVDRKWGEIFKSPDYW